MITSKKLIIASILALPISVHADFSTSVVASVAKNKKPLAAAGICAGLGALAYAKRKAIKKAAVKVKDTATNLAGKAAFALVVKGYECKEKIQDFELNYAHVVSGATFCATAYGFKKLDDKKKIIARVLGASKTAASAVPGLVAKVPSYVKSHKKELGVVTASLGAAYLLWKLGKSINADRQQSLITVDAFISSLTAEQVKVICKSSDLMQLVGNAEDNPVALIENEEFMALLSDKQKNLLNRIVDHYTISTEMVRAAY